ncbi:MAG: GNAT family N-acetyltransferase [Mogibacterium sp.]|nr:GNAT family N-acetyltransferase [Mogibacterium sp.]
MADYIIRTAAEGDLPAMGELRSYNSRTTLNDKYIDYRYLEFLTPSECTQQMINYFAHPENILIVAAAHEEAPAAAPVAEVAADDAAAVDGSADVEPVITCGGCGSGIGPDNPDSSELLGYAAGRPSPDILGAFWLEFLDVNEDTRGEGIGKRLIAEMGRRVRAQGYPQMVIDVLAGNDKAEYIYRHLGAEVLNDDYMQDQQGFLVKSKLLIWRDLSIF